jgi:hypothetical protein
VLVTVRPDHVAAVQDLGVEHGVDVVRIGTVGGDRVRVDGVVDFALEDVLAAVDGAVPTALGLD